MPLALPIRAAAAVFAGLALAELVLLPRSSPPVAFAAVHAVVLGTLLWLPRRPLVVLALVLLELFLAKELQINAMISVALALLTPFAAFATAALVSPARLAVVLLLLAAHVGWRATLPTGDTLTLVVTGALLASAALTGALLRRGHRRLAAVLAERDRLTAALADGPGDAATAEQLRMWSEVEQRIEPVIAALPALAEKAAGATHDLAAAHLEAVRAQAVHALAEMQATVRMLGAGERAEPSTHDAPPVRADVCVMLEGARGRRVTASPLVLACALLLAGAVAEQGGSGALALLLPLLPLLAPRAPVAAATAVALGVLAASATGTIGPHAVTPDFVAALTMLVGAAFATPRRAVAVLVIVEAGMLAALAADPAPWPAFSYLALALLLAGSWGGGVMLRGVAAEQRRVGAELAEAARGLEALERRAIQRERVRLARELHDLVGHALTGVAVQSAAALTMLQRGKPGADAAIERLQVAARQGAGELQRLAAVLGHDHETSISSELVRMTTAARASGQEVALELGGTVDGVGGAVRHAVVCLASEALTNAAKHAAGAPVRIRVDLQEDTLALDVIDDGGGSEGLPSGGSGLVSMAERVRACGGTLTSGPRPGGGWAVRALLPAGA